MFGLRLIASCLTKLGSVWAKSLTRHQIFKLDRAGSTRDTLQNLSCGLPLPRWVGECLTLVRERVVGLTIGSRQHGYLQGRGGVGLYPCDQSFETGSTYIHQLQRADSAGIPEGSTGGCEEEIRGGAGANVRMHWVCDNGLVCSRCRLQQQTQEETGCVVGRT